MGDGCGNGLHQEPNADGEDQQVQDDGQSIGEEVNVSLLVAGSARS